MECGSYAQKPPTCNPVESAIFDPKEVVTGARDAGESWQSIIWPTPAAPKEACQVTGLGVWG